MIPFHEINISTSTILALTNIEINLSWLYNIITPCNVHLLLSNHNINIDKLKKNKELTEKLHQLQLPYGSITLVEYKDKIKGIKLKKKRPFKNSLSIVMLLDKLITMKIPIKGKMHLTGCTREDQAIECIRILYKNYISKYKSDYQTFIINDVYTADLEQMNSDEKNIDIQYDENTKIKVVLKSVMTNINFNLGFNINREALDRYMNEFNEFNSLLETSIGYTGVNIKIPFLLKEKEDNITCLRLNKNDEWTLYKVPYMYYKHKFLKKKEKQEKHTFLVFYSGTVIMSGIITKYMEPVYNEFMNIIARGKDIIKETNID